jgi:uncharacterized membrane protein
MILMALDHASFFIARMHSREFWGTALPDYASALPFLLRLVSHLCAPGFFFLMGVGMALMAAARCRDGWSHGRLTRFFLVRGALLIGMQLLVENPAWDWRSFMASPAVSFRAAVLCQVAERGLPYTSGCCLPWGAS